MNRQKRFHHGPVPADTLDTHGSEMAVDIETLGTTEAAYRRPFTSPDLYAADQAILGRLADDLRGLLDGSRPVEAYGAVEWLVDGLKRRAIVCDPPLLQGTVDLNVVGFFGERNRDQDGSPLEEANAEIVLEFRNYPGILSYSSMELADGNWANLVLHDKPDTREYWRASRRHAEAAEQLSPLYYRTVRIHNGVLPGGLGGGSPIYLERTKYWDFRGRTMWRGVREMTPTASAPS